MKAFFSSVVFIIILVLRIYSQSSYEFTIDGLQDQLPGSLLEDSTGNVLFAVLNNQYAELYKINTEGDFIDSIRILNPIDGKCEFFTLLKISDSSFMAFGKYNEEFVNNLWIASFDFNLNKIFDFKMLVDGDIVTEYLYAIVNNSGNIVLASPYSDTGPFDSEIFLLEITKDGTIIKEKFFDPSGGGIELIFDLIQLNPLEYRLIKLGNIEKAFLKYIDLDTNFNIISENQLPYNMDHISYSSIKATSSSLYYSGIKIFPDKSGDFEMGLIKTDYNNILIDSAHFGRLDTVDSPGIHNNLDFTTGNSIFYGGYSNIDKTNPHYSSIPSWLLLNKLDTNFNIIWQKYYGGDACYVLWSLLATQDGGCVLAGTRYDDQIQFQERDVYIIKVNENGLITWTHNFPEIKNEILIYPNPGNDKVNIKTRNSTLKIEFYNSNGQKIIGRVINNQKITLNTSNLISGVYFYRIFNKNNIIIETGKWIKR